MNSLRQKTGEVNTVSNTSGRGQKCRYSKKGSISAAKPLIKSLTPTKDKAQNVDF